MIRLRDIPLPPEHNAHQLQFEAAQMLKISNSKIRQLRIVRRSVDARKKPDLYYNYVVDVGGDDVGARVIGRFSHLIEEDDYDMFCIVNANRENTQIAEDVIKHIKSIEYTSKLKVTGLISNTHLVRETTIDDILKGQSLVKEVSNLTNIPIKYITCLQSLIPQLPKDIEGEIFPIKLYMREDWM